MVDFSFHASLPEGKHKCMIRHNIPQLFSRISPEPLSASEPEATICINTYIGQHAARHCHRHMCFFAGASNDVPSTNAGHTHIHMQARIHAKYIHSN